MEMILLPVTHVAMRISIKHLKVFKKVQSTVCSKNSIDVSKLTIIITKTNINVSSFFLLYDAFAKTVPWFLLEVSLLSLLLLMAPFYSHIWLPTFAE